jgi:ribulose-phosphate 3-epimerase
MVMRPELYLETFASLGVANVIVHLGSTDAYDAIITHARTYRYQIGIALTNDRDLSELSPYIDRIDFVQVMGIAHVGKQGQPFDERTLTTLHALRTAYPTLPLSVDGAVNRETILKLRDAGATRFAPGSAIAKAPDPVLAYKQLAHMIGLS